MAPGRGPRRLTSEQRRMLVVVILIGALVVALSAAIGWLAVSMGAPVEVGVIIAVIVGAVVALFMFLNMV